VNDQTNTERLFWQFAPPVAAVLLIAAFVSLGFWQLDRAAEKIATRKLFDGGGKYVDVLDASPASEYQPLRATGHYIEDRQFLIDNMIAHGRLGYFVITPFEISPEQPLLMVNRGWLASGGDRNSLPAIPVDAETREIFGLSGHLPRVGIRPGGAFDGADGWPKLSTFPQMSDLADALGRDVLPFVLLLDPDSNSTLLRDWRPREQGPMMHYGYAFQWFAMAIALLAILTWQLRKRRNHVQR
jgi:surfeit locus 1 family protein